MRLIVQRSDEHETNDDQFKEMKKLSSPKKQTSSPEKSEKATNTLKGRVV